MNAFSTPPHLNDCYDLLALAMHPLRLSDIQDLLKAPSVREAFPALAKSDFCYEKPQNIIDESFLDTVTILANGSLELNSPHERERRARQVLLKDSRLAGAMRQYLSWHSSKDLERDALLRDIRNAFYIGDTSQLLSDLRSFSSYHPADFNQGDAFAFFLPLVEEPWLEQLPDDLLSLLCVFFLPLATAQLAPLQHLEDIILKRRDGLTPSALTALADNLLLQGKTELAEPLFDACPEEAGALCRAWAAYLLGDNSRSIQTFASLLQARRAATKDPNWVFQRVGGCFYFFALIRDGLESSRVTALEFARAGHSVPFLGAFYDAAVAFLCREPVPQPSPEMGPLASLLISFLSLWDAHADTRSLERTLTQFLPRLQENYPYLARECRNALYGLDGKPNEDSSLPDLTDIIPCVRVLLPWERMLNRFSEVLTSSPSGYSNRLVWNCVYDGTVACPVAIRPIEQRVTKSGKWSKCSRFPLLLYFDEKHWPNFVTSRDRFLCNLLLEKADDATRKAASASGFRNLVALEALVDHPNLFWDGPTPTPFSCHIAAPLLHIDQCEGGLHLELQPQRSDPKLTIVPVRDPQGNLILYKFTEMHLKLADAIDQGFDIPNEKLPRFLPLFRRLAEVCTILSDTPLDFPGLEVRQGDVTPHIRLMPHDQKMSVEVLVRPFQDLPRFYEPGEGVAEFLSCENGTLIRNVRDLEA